MVQHVEPYLSLFSSLCSQFQPSYQKYFKRSFRTLNYGKDKVRDLLVECPHLKLINGTVYLTESDGAAHVMPFVTMATSNLLSCSSSESGNTDYNLYMAMM